MAKPTLAGSARLHLRIGAFSGLFMALATSFTPLVAFALTIAASVALSKL